MKDHHLIHHHRKALRSAYSQLFTTLELLDYPIHLDEYFHHILSLQGLVNKNILPHLETYLREEITLLDRTVTIPENGWTEANETQLQSLLQRKDVQLKLVYKILLLLQNTEAENARSKK